MLREEETDYVASGPVVDSQALLFRCHDKSGGICIAFRYSVHDVRGTGAIWVGVEIEGLAQDFLQLPEGMLHVLLMFLVLSVQGRTEHFVDLLSHGCVDGDNQRGKPFLFPKVERTLKYCSEPSPLPSLRVCGKFVWDAK